MKWLGALALLGVIVAFPSGVAALVLVAFGAGFVAGIAYVISELERDGDEIVVRKARR